MVETGARSAPSKLTISPLMPLCESIDPTAHSNVIPAKAGTHATLHMLLAGGVDASLRGQDGRPPTVRSECMHVGIAISRPQRQWPRGGTPRRCDGYAGAPWATRGPVDLRPQEASRSLPGRGVSDPAGLTPWLSLGPCGSPGPP